MTSPAKKQNDFWIRKIRDNKIPRPVFTCLVCNHTWSPRKNEVPKRCAGCKTPYWNDTFSKVVHSGNVQLHDIGGAMRVKVSDLEDYANAEDKQ